MSGHSKWSQIKRKKGANDAARAKLFTKLIREITVAARNGGGDPAGNPRLRTAVQGAHAANMPADNIERAIQKGTGELPGVHYEEVLYEGYAPGGIAILVQCLTDNKNRTVMDIRHLFAKYHGSLSTPGAVAWKFEPRGSITVEKRVVTEDMLMGVALDAGALDVDASDGHHYEIQTPFAALESVRLALAQHGIPVAHCEPIRHPLTTTSLPPDDAEKVLRMVEALEDCDDAQRVYTDLEITEDILSRLT